MSRPRFLADNDLKDAIVEGVQRREPALIFMLARDAGVDRQPDDVVLQYASRNGLIVVSHDVTTMSDAAYDRVAAGLPMAGLLLVSQSKRVAPVIDNLLLIWTASEAAEWEGKVMYLPIS